MREGLKGLLLMTRARCSPVPLGVNAELRSLVPTVGDRRDHLAYGELYGNGFAGKGALARVVELRSRPVGG